MTFLTGCGNKLNSVGEFIEERFRLRKESPQYKYLTRPVYKFFVTKTGSVAATFFSFLSADLVIHQLAPRVMGPFICKRHHSNGSDNSSAATSRVGSSS